MQFVRSAERRGGPPWRGAPGEHRWRDLSFPALIGPSQGGMTCSRPTPAHAPGALQPSGRVRRSLSRTGESP